MTTHAKQYYSIGEAARKLGITISALRFWERHFPMFRPMPTAKGMAAIRTPT